MAVTFNIQFKISVATKVIRLTDTSTGFTYGKGCFKVEFPNGVVRNLPDFSTPDISTAGDFIDIPCELDVSGNVVTGSYIISYAVINNLSAGQTPLVRTFDFNWIEPSNGITNFSDVIIPEVVFKDLTSYSPIGSFTGALTRTISGSFPSTSEASANSPITSTSTNTITVVSGANYYEGSYTPTSNVSVAYTHSSNAWLTILYTRTFSKTFAIKKCPNQLELVQKINAYRVIIDAYKETNDTQFNLLSEQYDLVIGLYSHLIARYSTNTQDGSEPILRELLSILEPYTGTYTYQATKMLPFELTSSGTNSFNISDGTNVDAIQLGSTLTFASGNASLVPIVTNNNVTYSPTFGTLINTFAQGNDSRFHNPVTIGTANGLSISTQALSLAAATTGSAGAMSSADKTKLDGIATGATANVGTVTSVALTTPAAFSVTGSPITTAGTLAIAAAGTSAQYITGAGALATLNTLNVPENTNLYFTTSRARTSISLTTTGTTGAATYDNATGVLNIPSYIGGVTSFNTRTGAIVLSSADVTTALTYTPVPNNRSLTINGVSFDLSADRSWTIASGVTSFNSRTGAITPTSGDYTTALVTESGNLYYTDARARAAISLTTTGTSGSATYNNTTGVLNIPAYQGGVTSFNTRTGAITLTSGDVTTALSYTPYNATNPSGYISGITSGNVTTALGFTPENAANKGIANGYASLDGGGLVPSTQLPSYVDDVLEFANLASLPATGETGKIYVALDTNKIYRWSGATYIEVSPTVGTIWGGITGTLSNQTDLQNALNLKYNTPTGTTSQYVAGDGSLIAFPVAGQSGSLVRLVRNSTGATLTKGTVVYISGATGNNPVVSKAIATGDPTSAQTFGLLQSDIANNATGYVVITGDLIGLNTSAFTEGQQLYLSGTVAGTYTATKQYAPNHLVYIGIITRSHPTLGQIEVKIQNGYELDELHDVSAQSPANNDIIAFNTTSGLWEKKSIATTLGYTPVTNARTITINGTALDLSADRSYNVGTVTSVSALTLGTTGTDVSSTVATGTTTPAITLNIPTASASNRGALSSADWTTFNNKANALSGTTNTIPKFTSSSAIGNSNITDTGSLVTITNSLTLSGSVTGTGNISNYSVTASAGSATSKKITSTLVASANSDVLVGLDINPTFTNGSFTGVTNNALRVTGTTRFQGTTASDTAPLGSELAAVTGTGTNWTLAGTNLNVGGYSHTTGDVTPLTTTLAAVSGTYYQITYTITGRTAGSITIAYGGTSTAGITATGNTGPLASSTGVLTITPTTDFNGTVVLSIKSIGTSSASSTFTNSAGTPAMEIRSSGDVTNTFIGTNAGSRFNSLLSSFNTFIGNNAGQNNTTGSSNIFVGALSGTSTTTGLRNISIGGLLNNITGSFNTAVGNQTLQNITLGSNNVAIGYLAGRNISGGTNLTSADTSVFIGSSSRALGNGQSNQVVIGGDLTTGLGSNTTILGNSSTLTTAIYGNLVLGSTTDAGYKLDVTGTARVSGVATFSSSVSATSYNATTQNIFAVDGSERMRIKSNGNIGIGTSTDVDHKLKVAGIINSANGASDSVGGGAAYLLDGSSTNGSSLTFLQQSVSRFAIWTYTGSAWGERMTITSAGNVGIGTTSPSYKLSVVGPVLGNAISWTDTANNTGYLGIRGASASIGADNNLVFETAATERMRITSNGNVGIGTTSPSQKLDVNGTIRAAGAFVQATGNIFVGDWVGFYDVSTSTSKVYLLQFVPTEIIPLLNYRLFGVIQTNTVSGSYYFTSIASQTMEVRFVGNTIQTRITNGQSGYFNWSITQLC